MNFNRDQEAFINNYVKALRQNNAVIFAGAGLSISTGMFDWERLMSPIAKRLGLDIKEEPDLTALAQYFVDSQGGIRGELDQILVEEYGKLDIRINENHRILARLPIQIYWTTNYDRLLEEALKEIGKTPDVKKTQSDLSVNYPKRDAIVYKMHGDIGTVAETVLTKHEYEDYNRTRELFSNAFKSDFVSRTFLFIGFSFTDPNLDYLISRIRTTLGRNKKPDYFFIKKDLDARKQHRQEIRVNSLKLYGLNAIWINDYPEITEILHEIEIRYLRSTILISGSAEEYARLDQDSGRIFIHDLSKAISAAGYKIVSGFGLGVGSSVINGVLDNMTYQKNLNLDNYLILRPFPQYQTGIREKKELWTQYRHNFIPLAGIAVFIFGNKRNVEGNLISADGMIEEFELAVSKGLKVIPIGATGYVARELWEKVISTYSIYYPERNDAKAILEQLGDYNANEQLIKNTIELINLINYK